MVFLDNRILTAVYLHPIQKQMNNNLKTQLYHEKSINSFRRSADMR